MANIFSKRYLKKAVKDYSKFDLSSNHLTTTDFGQCNVVNGIDCVVGDRFSYQFNQFSRLATLTFPTYGEVGMRSIATFVPYYLVADDADAYISGLTSFNGRAAVGRFFSQATLDTFLWGSLYTSVLDPGHVSPFLDFIERGDELGFEGKYKNPSYFRRHVKVPAGGHDLSMIDFYRLNSKGRYLLKLLNSLGYQINQDIYTYAFENGTILTLNGNVKLNAYPFLCYVKAFCDLMLPNAFYSTSPLLSFLNGVKTLNSYYVDEAGNIIVQRVHDVLGDLAKVYYDSDYFTSAWQSPNSALTSNPVTDLSVDESVNSIHLSTDAGNNSLRIVNDKLSAVQLSWLQSFDKFVRRNNLVGFREFNAIYARFGIKPSEMRSNYCQVLDIRNLDLSVGDVTATSSSESEPLGSYAGKGFMRGDSSFKFECKDYGFFLHFAYLYVVPIYMQGIRKHCLRSSAFDFYQPEFDGVGPAPISKLELNCTGKIANKVFGYTERYNEYRTQLDNVTGDFKYDELMYPWHTARVFKVDEAPVAQSDNMIRYVPDRNGNMEYDRIFTTETADGTTAYDHFYQVWNFHVTAYRPMQNINAAVGLGVGDVKVDANGAV